MTQPEPQATGEYLVGLEAVTSFISDLIGEPVSERRAQYMIESGVIPAGRLGGRICASRKAIKATFELASTEAQPPPPPAIRPVVLEERNAHVLLCKSCGRTFPRPLRGRPPKRCPTCRR
jgi:hypothetical protein